jgi:hypothetical protein
MEFYDAAEFLDILFATGDNHQFPRSWFFGFISFVEEYLQSCQPDCGNKVNKQFFGMLRKCAFYFGNEGYHGLTLQSYCKFLNS